MQKPRDGRLSHRDLFLPQSVAEFGQRDVRLLRYQLPHQILMRRQREILVAAEFGRIDAARLPVKLEEADDGADADSALLRSFRDGGPALDRLDHSSTQIPRIRLRHSCWPPPSRQLESYSRHHGNPRFSLLGKRSSKEILDFFMKTNLMTIGPNELEQFSYDVSIERKDNTLVLKTDEADVSAFFKLLIDRGARVEIFSAHQYPESAPSRK
jgi:uncharacterized protein DUF6375